MQEKPQQLSRKQLGQLRRMHLTIQHSTVEACEHKYIPGREPALNCDYCWYAFFKVDVDLPALHDMLRRQGPEAVVALRGVKFLKKFKRFLQTELTPGELNGICEEA